MLRKKNDPSIRKNYGAMPSGRRPTSFMDSCSGASINIIRQFIEQQTPH